MNTLFIFSNSYYFAYYLEFREAGICYYYYSMLVLCTILLYYYYYYYYYYDSTSTSTIIVPHSSTTATYDTANHSRWLHSTILYEIVFFCVLYNSFCVPGIYFLNFSHIFCYTPFVFFIFLFSVCVKLQILIN